MSVSRRYSVTGLLFALLGTAAFAQASTSLWVNGELQDSAEVTGILVSADKIEISLTNPSNSNLVITVPPESSVPEEEEEEEVVVTPGPGCSA